MKQTCTLLFLLLGSLLASARSSTPESEKPFFIRNQGQWPSEVLYLSRSGGLDAWITQTGIVYDFYRWDHSAQQRRAPRSKNEDLVPGTRHGQVVRLSLAGGGSAVAQGADHRSAYYNYFIGNNPQHWASQVALMGEVTVKNVYPGIDQRYYYEGSGLRYDFILHPGADLSLIRMQLKGTGGMRINQAGEMEFDTRFGKVSQAGLYAYQEKEGRRQQVSCSFVRRKEGSFGFAAGQYDPSLPLIIDPLLYSTFLGGTGEDMAASIAVDASSNAVTTGITMSANFPTTTGVYDVSQNGFIDMFVTQLNPGGTALVYSTFIGTAGTDYAKALALDAAGNVYLTGHTSHSNFPVTAGAFDNTIGGGLFYGDAVAVKLNAAGTALLYSTYIGGSGDDRGFDIAVDASGNAYICGATVAPDFPTTPGAYDLSFNSVNANREDAFVVKLNSTGTALLYGTYLGGTESDWANGLAVDAAGNAHITGYSSSPNFPVTPGVPDPVSGSASYSDAFAVKLNATGTGLVYSSFLGGSLSDEGTDVALDAAGRAVYLGYTASTDFPVTPGAYDTSCVTDMYVAKFNTSGTALEWSTLLGYGASDAPASLALDALDNVCVAGWVLYAGISGFPTTPGAIDTSYNGGDYDAVVVKLNSTGTALLYGTYLGGAANDLAYGIALDAAGNAYVAGTTTSAAYPTVPGSYDVTNAGPIGGLTNGEGFVSKLNFINCPGNFSATASNAPVCEGDTLKFVAGGGVSYSWTGPNGFSSSSANPTVPNAVAAAAGNYHLTATNADGCVERDTVNVVVAAYPQAIIVPGGTISFCAGNSATLFATAGNYTYQWQKDGANLPGSTASSYTANAAGSYTVVVSNAGVCRDTSVATVVTVSPLPTPVATYAGGMLSTGAYVSYQWYLNGQPVPGATGPSYTPPQSASQNGSYYVVVQDATGCSGQSNNVVVSGLSAGSVATVKVAVYPNPATDQVFIDAAQPLRAMLRDLQGRVLVSMPRAARLDIGALAGGVYFLTLYDQDGLAVYSGKLLKEHR